MSSSPVALAPFGPAARAWFAAAFAEATPVQRDGWARIAAGEHSLLLAPTGSGKTLAAFFYAIDQLGREAGERAAGEQVSRNPKARNDAQTSEVNGPGVRLLYISPLKALVADKYFGPGHPFSDAYFDFGQFAGRRFFELVPDKMIGWDQRETTTPTAYEARVLPEFIGDRLLDGK